MCYCVGLSAQKGSLLPLVNQCIFFHVYSIVGELCHDFYDNGKSVLVCVNLMLEPKVVTYRHTGGAPTDQPGREVLHCQPAHLALWIAWYKRQDDSL